MKHITWSLTFILMFYLVSFKPVASFSWSRVFNNQSGRTKKKAQFSKDSDQTLNPTPIKDGHNQIIPDNFLANEPAIERPLPEDDFSFSRESSIHEKSSNRLNVYPADQDRSSSSSHHTYTHPKRSINEIEPQIKDSSIHTSPNTRENTDHAHEDLITHPIDVTRKTNHPLITKEIEDMNKQLGPEMEMKLDHHIPVDSVHALEGEVYDERIHRMTGLQDKDRKLKSNLAQGIEETIAGLTRVYHSLHLFEGGLEEGMRKVNVSTSSVPVHAGIMDMGETHEGSGNDTEDEHVMDEIESDVESHRKDGNSSKFVIDHGKKEQQNSGRTGLLVVGLVCLIGAIGLMAFAHKRNRDYDIETPLYPPRGPSFV